MGPEAIAVLASLSFALFAVYGWMGLTHSTQGLVWHPRAVWYFFGSGFFEALGALLTLIALTTGRVVIVSPIVATTPLFSLIISLIFFCGNEQVTGRTILGTIAVGVGTIAIALGK